MSVTEIGALLDAHDVLVSACLDGSLSLQEFVASYGQFPQGYGFNSAGANGEVREALALFRQRIAFHQDVAKIIASLGDGPMSDGLAQDFGSMDEIGSTEGGGFMAQAVILRLRQLAARHPGFSAKL
jgi:hypothetical protein